MAIDLNHPDHRAAIIHDALTRARQHGCNCNSTAELTEIEPRVWTLTIGHDDHCAHPSQIALRGN